MWKLEMIFALVLITLFHSATLSRENNDDIDDFLDKHMGSAENTYDNRNVDDSDVIGLLKRVLESEYRERESKRKTEDTEEKLTEVNKRTSHKHGFLFFFVDANHDYKISTAELATFLQCPVFKDTRDALLQVFMGRDKDKNGLDVKEWEEVESLSRHSLAMELLRYT